MKVKSNPASQNGCPVIYRRFVPQNHRWMKKYVLQCNRRTVVARFFNINFVYIKKEDTLETRLISKKTFFCLNQLNILLQIDLGRNFPTVQNGPEKRKNLYSIKFVSKWKRPIRKRHKSFLFFHFWDLKLVPIDSTSNSTSGNLTHVFFSKM